MDTTKTHKKPLSIEHRIKTLENRNLIIDNNNMLNDFIKKKNNLLSFDWL